MAFFLQHSQMSSFNELNSVYTMILGEKQRRFLTLIELLIVIDIRRVI
jgi:hypothetical protein